MPSNRVTKLCITVAAVCAVGNIALHGCDAYAGPGTANMRKTVRFAAAPGPLDNPMKGWCTYTFPGELHQPYSLVYRYVSWKQLEPTEGHYEFGAWEKQTWSDPLAAGKMIVFRVYLDYPGQPSGVPDWLLAKGLKTRPYSDYGGGNSPDYDNPDLVAGLERLIAAMGKRYDHNPRVAFIELGLLGFWGEWHTYPHTEMFADDSTQKKIIDAYHAAFPDKILLGRYAKGYMGEQPWIGFHDDMFPDDTDGPENWKFLPGMRTAGRTQNWRHAVIGGEMDPGHAQKWLSDPGFATTMNALETGHFSWIGPYNPGMDPNQSTEFVQRSEEMVRRMGYQYCLDSLTYSPVVASGRRLHFAISAQNQGVAPFYYPWPVELALISPEQKAVATAALTADIRTWMPGNFAVSDSPILRAAPGEYKLAIGIVNPYTGQPDVKFANNLPVWNGWTILSDIRITR